jgi:alpha-1,3-rhamnosyl/mannosyltransferase
MRILLPLDNPGGGGIARVGRDLAVGLSHRLPGDDRLVVLGAVEGLRAVPGTLTILPAGSARGRVGRVMGDQLRVRRAAREADLVHMPDAKAPLLTARPFTLTIHDLFFLDHPEWFPRSVTAYKRAMLAASLARRPRAVVCVSGYTRERLLAHHPRVGDRCPVEVINPGLFRSPTMPAPSPGGQYLLTVSAIEPRKNHLGLLAAFRAARRRGLDLTWKIVGRPQYDSEPIMGALQASEGVEVVGRVSEPQLERLYRGARFVATPSLAEGFGYPPLEAMARGVPVVCSSGSALDETVGDAALRIDATDQDGWAGALLALNEDEDLRQRLIAAGLRNAERFSWEGSADAHLALFHRVSGAAGR